MNSIKKQNSLIQGSLFESLLHDYAIKPEENFKNYHGLGESQEYKMTQTEVQGFLNEVPNEQLLLNDVESVSSFEENQEEIMDEKVNVIETQQCFIQKNQFSLVGFVKMDSKEDFIFKEQMEIDIQQQITPKKENFKSIFKQRKLKGEWKKNTNVPKFLARIFMKHFSSCITEQSSEQVLNHHRKMKKILQSRVSNNYSISDVLSLLRSSQFSDKSLNLENQKILSQIICKTLQSEVIENKYIKNNQMSYMMAIKLYAIRCRSSSLTERVKIF